MALYILLPAYNEAKSLPNLLQKFQNFRRDVEDLKIVIVDDGSQDDTAVIAESFQGLLDVEVIRHGQNRGLGCAMTTGLKWICKVAKQDDVVVTMDADDTHDPGHIPAMMEKIRRGADVVIASRYQEGGEQVGLSQVRRLMSWGASTFLGVLFGIEGVKDYSSGYRAYRVGILQQAFERFGDNFIEAQGFDCMAEILLKLRTFQPNFAEVPLVLRYDRKTGPSKMPVLETVFQYLFLARKAARLDDR
ncbi:glycosyltransferase [Heliorestis acidaminivorans]|uniref:Glycosyltransferase n=1 Tax=Heliorestis acidaminivorans TaxID=553427 RepID=A0A6I0EZU8_9FIRM|nr:glycosyltransferase [Heliorestis acidaminivorans]KAB2952571.1 glycosyltransferase [Heliorestis acidaminivorans]